MRAEPNIGEVAPPLRLGQWIRGEPVRAFDSNHVYVLFFWASWSEASRAQMYHFIDLSDQFYDRGLVLLAVDVWDRDAAAVRATREMADRMRYRVALDDKSLEAAGFMAAHWWPQGLEGHDLPMAFVVDRSGHILWKGQPRALKESLVETILAGHLTLAEAEAAARSQEQARSQWQDLNERLPAMLNEHQWEKAAELFEQLLQRVPPAQRASYAVGPHLKILLGQKLEAPARQLVEAYCQKHPRNAFQLNELAWTLLNQEDSPPRNIALANQVAQQAEQATGGTNAVILGTLARAQFMSGNTNQAMATQRRAAELAGKADKTRQEQTLASYQQGLLPQAQP